MGTPLAGVARPKVARFIGLTRSGEEELADALTLLADRHDRDSDVRDMLTKFARWTRARHDRMAPHTDVYGEFKSEHPERLRAAFYYGTRMGGVGLVQDLQDLLVHHHEVAAFYLTLQQVAEELRDQELLATAQASHTEVERQHAWVKTRLKTTAPQAIVVPTDHDSELAASIPKRPSVVAQPDVLWAPLAASAALVVVGIASLLAGRPFLFPSLGPTAYLVAEHPAHPTSSMKSVLGGHGIAIGVAILAVLVTGAAGAPSPLQTGVPGPARLLASVLAIALLLLLAIPLRVSHPPAAATTLLITLGIVRTVPQIAWLTIGVVVIAIAGELLRRVRLRQLPAAPGPRAAELSRR